MKTILSPTYLSLETDLPMYVAVSLAHSYQTEVILLHLLNSPTIRNDSSGQLCAISGQAVELLVIVSPAVTLLDIFLTNISVDVFVPYAHCSVLFTKTLPIYSPPKNVLLAVDVDDRRKSNQAFPFTLNKQGVRQFLYVMPPTDYRDAEEVVEVCSWVNDFACAKGISDFSFAIHPAQYVAKNILLRAEALQADLIVLFDYGSGQIAHRRWGSVIKDVLAQAQIPVLIMQG
ncbi:universal stress protein [Spirosoma aureum]|uniref:Universal stress protein n=1 Tax=Spirosoma aureum TaxID=2692134 RepID=A0A6G9AN08_9BACT|nr:universal stress protein [Spirosoma aureum]QIP13729.1 universal stress protein [Spirosoma aureum]